MTITKQIQTNSTNDFEKEDSNSESEEELNEKNKHIESESSYSDSQIQEKKIVNDLQVTTSDNKSTDSDDDEDHVAEKKVVEPELKDEIENNHLVKTDSEEEGSKKANEPTKSQETKEDTLEAVLHHVTVNKLTSVKKPVRKVRPPKDAKKLVNKRKEMAVKPIVAPPKYLNPEIKVLDINNTEANDPTPTKKPPGGPIPGVVSGIAHEALGVQLKKTHGKSPENSPSSIGSEKKAKKESKEEMTEIEGEQSIPPKTIDPKEKKKWEAKEAKRKRDEEKERKRKEKDELKKKKEELKAIEKEKKKKEKMEAVERKKKEKEEKKDEKRRRAIENRMTS